MLQTIYQLIDAVSRAAALEEIYDGALDGLEQTLKCDRAAILLSDADGVMRLKAERGLSDECRKRAESHTLWPRGETNPQPIIIADLEAEQNGEPLHKLLFDEGVKALGFIPLMNNGALLGKFMICCLAPREFTGEEIQLARTIASHVALAIGRKLGEQVLRASQERFSRAFKANPDAMSIRRLKDGRYVDVNDSFLRITGYSRDDILGRNVASLGLMADREDINKIAHMLRENGSVDKFEFMFLTKSGELRVGLLSAEVIELDGEPHSLTVTTDITESKRVEQRNAQLLAEVQRERQRLDNVVANVPGIVWEAWGRPDKANQRIDFVSDYVEEMLGYSVDEWLSTPNFWLNIVHPDDKEKAAQVAAEHFANRKGGINQFRWIARDGRVVWIEAHDTIIVDETGEPVGMRGVSMDITERKLAEEERAQLLEREQEARAQAEAANRTKDEFLATVSHELRTPLTAILGWANMLRTRELDPGTAAQAFQTIERNAKAQAQIIDDILDVSRIITGKLRLNVRPIEARSVIHEAIDAVRPAAEAKGIRIQTTIDTPANVLMGDPNRMQQVIWNLLSNAIKFTPAGGQVEVQLARLDSQVEITVIDTGQGINAEFLPYVFDRFRQADGSYQRKHGGLGLGLSIVRHIVEMHGGTVEAHSEGEGRGATFTLKIPLMITDDRLAAGNMAERDEPAGKDHAHRDYTAILAGLEIILVDDEPDTLQMLRLLMEKSGARVKACASAVEAFQAVKERAPDILISDIGMPGEDGYVLINRIRALELERGGSIPALALTAYARAEDRAQTLAAGYQRHINKPVDPLELVETIAALAGRVAKA